MRPIGSATSLLSWRYVSSNLTAPSTPGDAVQQVQVDGTKIAVLPAGPPPDDPADLLESAGALMHTSPLQKGRRRAELGQRRMYHVPGFVAELVRTAAGAPNRN